MNTTILYNINIMIYESISTLSLGTSRTLILARLLWVVQCSINSIVR